MKHIAVRAQGRSLAVACFLMSSGLISEAATLRWTGLGLSPLWSDAANWDGLSVPQEGDALLFGGPSNRPDSVIDLNRSFASLTFAADSPAFALRVHGSAGVLTFDGIGIRNVSAGSSPIRQDFYADGGKIAFLKQAGLNLDTAGNLRPVNLTARNGGQIAFQDDAATSPSTFDLLRAEGATAAAGMAGSISFSGRALATRSATVTLTGGTLADAAGGQASFSDMARADAIFNLLTGENRGGGARVEFSGHASATVFASFYNAGATTVGAAAQAISTFHGDAILAGSANNEAGRAVGAYGGLLQFRDRASHDSSGMDPSLGIVLIRNGGATSAGARSGGTVFSDDSFIRGTQLQIINAVQAEGAEPNSPGGTTDFLDRSHAGQASLLNAGAAAPGAGSGGTRFSGQASAEEASIVNAAGGAAGTAGGTTVFSGSAVAGTARIANNANSSGGGGSGGSTVFADDSSAQQATITNQAGQTTVDYGTLRFHDRASAGRAQISNLGAQVPSAFGGATSFDGNSSAGDANLLMAGGGAAQALGGFAVFYADSTAGTATLDLRAATVSGATGGRVQFFDRASAGAAHVSVAGSPVDHVLGSEGGTATFADASSAANASFVVGGNSFAGGGVGALRFSGASTAAHATLTQTAGQTRGGALSFEGMSATVQASAGSAIITNEGSSSGAGRSLAIGGLTTFMAFSTAGGATISNGAGFGAGLTQFFAASSAGDARLDNLGGAVGEDGGTTQFSNSSSAERALIVNRAGAQGANGFDAAGSTRFVDQSTAAQARITADGGRSSGVLGGLISFNGAANPATASLIAEGGVNGGTGGRIRFAGLTNASQVHVSLTAGDDPSAAGELDISGMTVAGVAIGTLDGGGTVALGGRTLTVWSNTRSQFSGLLRDGGLAGGTGGSLSVSGGATVTLMGANTYSGVTRIGDGLNAGSGKLVVANVAGSATGSGEVIVQRGGILAGSGFINGPVTLMDGGLIAPGDPVTLSLTHDLTWNGGGVIRLVLGASDADSDHLVVHRLVRGSGGPFVFDLVDFGQTADSSYDLLQFDSLVGFTASDFSFVGLAGTFAVQDGRLEFTTAAVPEPAQAFLWLLGLIAISAHFRSAHRSSSPSPVQRRRDAACGLNDC